jgi:hypothetical protein
MVVALDEPPGCGEVINMRAVGRCASHLRYLARGTKRILRQELSGVRLDGSPVSRGIVRLRRAV